MIMRYGACTEVLTDNRPTEFLEELEQLCLKRFFGPSVDVALAPPSIKQARDLTIKTGITKYGTNFNDRRT
jgi:hypothetical protein